MLQVKVFYIYFYAIYANGTNLTPLDGWLLHSFLHTAKQPMPFFQHVKLLYERKKINLLQSSIWNVLFAAKRGPTICNVKTHRIPLEKLQNCIVGGEAGTAFRCFFIRGNLCTLYQFIQIMSTYKKNTLPTWKITFQKTKIAFFWRYKLFDSVLSIWNDKFDT